jgi:hypothetical protein
MEFWTEPQMASIHKMLNPRSIAIVGSTPRMQYGGRFLAAALKAKDRVRVAREAGVSRPTVSRLAPGAATRGRKDFARGPIKEKLAGGGWWLLGKS